VGLLCGGLLSASVAGFVGELLGWVPLAWRVTALAAFAGAIVLRDFRLLSLPLPQNHRQVPRDVFGNGLRRAALQFGFELGTGVRTYVPAGAPYVLAAALALGVATTPEVLAAGIGFGAGRASMPLVRRWSGNGDRWDHLLGRRLSGLVPASSIACAMAATSTGVSRIL
jgi:hypothetical protein